MAGKTNVAVVAIMSLTLVMLVATMYVMWIKVMTDPATATPHYYDRGGPLFPPGPQFPGGTQFANGPQYSVPPEIRVSQTPPTAPDRPYVPSRAKVDFSQVGFVHKPDRTVMMPLYGRPAPRNPSRWQYFVRANDNDIRIGARRDGKACLDDVGCPELQSGETIQVPEVAEGDLVATVYDTSASTAMEGITRRGALPFDP